MSSRSASIGREELRSLASRVKQQKALCDQYASQLVGLSGISVMRELPGTSSPGCVTCIIVEPSQCGATRDEIRIALQNEKIAISLVPKPLHHQPDYSHCRAVGGRVADMVYDHGICLPVDAATTEPGLARIAKAIHGVTGIPVNEKSETQVANDLEAVPATVRRGASP